MKEFSYPDMNHERQLGEQIVCGIDEAGRGPLAGPVVAAAVIIPDRPDILEALSNLNDSKKISKTKREKLYPLIEEHCAVGIGRAEPEEIDRINIREATFLAMRRALKAIPDRPDYALVDGNADPGLPIKTETIIKGDSKSLSIAAASVIAKVSRDREMTRLAAEYPHYGWTGNAGYPTKSHIDALRQYGVSPYHRRSFAPVAKVVQLKEAI